MTMAKRTKRTGAGKANKAKHGLRRGEAVVWPKGLEARYGISAPTRWRWEKDGKLPPRDVHVGGRTGWKPATLEAAEASRA